MGSSTSAELTTSHTVVLSGLQPSTEYHFVVSSTDESSASSSSTDLVFQTVSSVGPTVDDFNSGEGLATHWVVEDPVGGAVVETTGIATSDARLKISLPGGQNRDAWDTNRSTRIMQLADDADFELEVAFGSLPSQAYQLQGLLIEQDAQHWLRFDFYSAGSGVRMFAAATVDGDSTALYNASVSAADPLLMRVQREGDS